MFPFEDKTFQLQKGEIYEVTSMIAAIPYSFFTSRKVRSIFLIPGMVFLYLEERKINFETDYELSQYSSKILLNNELYITYNKNQLKKNVKPLTK